jgi:hypothetical protein
VNGAAQSSISGLSTFDRIGGGTMSGGATTVIKPTSALLKMVY